MNKCGAHATACTTWAQTRTPCGNALPKTGKQADASNAVFGEVTDSTSVTPLDDQGQVVAACSVLRCRVLSTLMGVKNYLEGTLKSPFRRSGGGEGGWSSDIRLLIS